jgi:hypothetical protein
VKADVDMVDVDTLKQVSPTNPHVLEVTRQVFGITNSVSEVQSLEPQVFEVQASKAQVLEFKI